MQLCQRTLFNNLVTKIIWNSRYVSLSYYTIITVTFLYCTHKLYKVIPQAFNIGVYQRPNYKPPHTFLVVTTVVMITCAILNITSLMFGVPALIMTIMVSRDVSLLSCTGTTVVYMTLITPSKLFI